MNDKEFIKKLDVCREARNSYNKDLLVQNVQLVDLDDDNTNIRSGRIRINKGTARFECFFHRGINKSDNKLYIVLSAARTSKRSIPQFNRWSWYNNVDDHWLCIEDPMYFNHDEIVVGWFYGTAQENYRQYLADIAQFFSKKLGVQKSNVIFYGSSSGGPAALHAAALFGGGVGISINGQYNYEYDRFDVEDFKDKLNINLNLNDSFDRNNVAAWIQHKSTSFIIIGNVRSKWDREDHLKYLANKLNLSLEIGLNHFDNLLVWLYEANGYLGNPHSSFEDRNLFYSIDFIANRLVCRKSIEEFKELYLLFNEFWFDKYEYERKLLPESILQESERRLSLQNIDINSLDDRCFNYRVPIKILRNKNYHIIIDLSLEKCATKSFTIGVVNWKKKVFVSRLDVILNKPKMHFNLLIDHDDVNNRLLIFSGIHGKCQNTRLYIENLEIYTS